MHLRLNTGALLGPSNCILTGFLILSTRLQHESAATSVIAKSHHNSPDKPTRSMIGANSGGMRPFLWSRRICLPVQSSSFEYNAKLIPRKPLSLARFPLLLGIAPLYAADRSWNSQRYQPRRDPRALPVALGYRIAPRCG